MVYEIKHRLNGSIIFSGEFDSVKDCVEAALKAGASLRGANLRGANLRGANLRDADLRSANLRDADLRGANLCGATLRGANLRDADLRSANLRDADLRSATLRSTNLRGANLCGATLRGANLWCAVSDGVEIITIMSKKYTINIITSAESIQIGCERYLIKDWLSFGDGMIKNMDYGALDWWRVYKPILIMHLKALDLLQDEVK